jgi:hypothetical protein
MYVVKHKKAETFDFEVDGETYSVPLARHVTVDEAFDIADRGNVATRDLFEAHAPGCTKSLTAEEFGDLVSAWIDASGASVGES